MVLKTESLLGLLGIGAILLLLGLPWWMGIGVIIAALALATGTDGVPMQQQRSAPFMQPVATAAGAQQMQSQEQAEPPEPPKPWWVKQREADETSGSFLDPLKLRPSVPPDGFCGIGSISTPKEERVFGDDGNLSVGKRTGAASFYVTGDDTSIGRVRIKDDFRFHFPWMSEKDPETGIKPLTNLVTTHLRTNKKIIKTKVLQHPTFEQWDKELFDGPDFDLDK